MMPARSSNFITEIIRMKGIVYSCRKSMRKICLSRLSNRIEPCRMCSGTPFLNEELSRSTKHAIENHWADKIAPTTHHDMSKEKFYVLSMFPYPSGQLHMGHVRVYTISDVMARFYRMNGKNVIHPMGWDAFGLPAENAAREHCVEPSKWTIGNIERMKEQLNRLGCSFDWEREVATCDPSYYHWTQSIFLKLYSKGLIYQKEALVNWDPVDETVLADEQVDEKGRSWRSGAVVEKKWLKQWFIKTTKFAKLLLDGLDDPKLQDWRDISKLQRHWIGICKGTTFEFSFVLEKDGEKNTTRSLTVWTENPELIYGVGFIAVSPENSINLLISEDGMGEVLEDTVNEIRWKRLPFKAIHPFTKKELPVIVLYPFIKTNAEGEKEKKVYFHIGTDCRLGFPGENSVDYNIAVAEGLHPYPKMLDEESGKMLQASGPLSGLSILEARVSVCNKAIQLNVGGDQVSPQLRDWLISRQRYWGTPIPMVHCVKCGAVPVKEDDLPVTLPQAEMNSSKAKDSHKVFTLDKNEIWKQTSCPSCGGEAQRETDTMDTFVDSSWYFLRFLDPKNNKAPFSSEKAKQFMPVDLYIGGKEHAVLHLYYARFMSYFFYSEGLISQPEPFSRLLVQGMVMGKTYRSKSSGKYLHPREVKLEGKKAFEKDTGGAVSISWEKMSKSKYNGVEPSDMIDEHGADTTRLLVLADVAPTSHRNWTPETFPGIINWQRRLWLTVNRFRELRSSDSLLSKKDDFEEEELKIWDSRNFYLKGASFNYKISYQLSIAISKMQGLTNSLRRASPAVMQQGMQFERALAVQLMLLAPMAPHFASELWSGFVSAPRRVDPESLEIDWENNVLEQKWPEVDQHYPLELICKLNGAEKCRFKIPRYELDVLEHKQALDMCFSHPAFALMSQETCKGMEGKKKKVMVDSTFVNYPSYQATLNILTEAGIKPVEAVNKQMINEEGTRDIKKKKLRV